jgi:CRISPR-associated protein Csx14
MKSAILIATLGAEPQVVTLTLDSLLARGERIASVIVVHTAPDREPVRSSLRSLHHEFVVERPYGDEILFVPHLLAGASGPLADVVTPSEIDDAFRSLYVLLRQHKQAGRSIHLSIAGGRKTMALFAMAAAQVVFGLEDHVWHLVSDPALVISKRLHTDRPGDIILVPVPVAYWGRLRPDDSSRVHDFIKHVLTPAEREVTELLIREGLSNAALAERLGKSIKTVANQLSSVYVKLGRYFDLPETPDRALLLVLLGSYS